MKHIVFWWMGCKKQKYKRMIAAQPIYRLHTFFMVSSCEGGLLCLCLSIHFQCLFYIYNFEFSLFSFFVCLFVLVYNEEEGALYIHHDILLPAFPLTIEWLNFDPGEGSPGMYMSLQFQKYMLFNVNFCTKFCVVFRLKCIACIQKTWEKAIVCVYA